MLRAFLLATSVFAAFAASGSADDPAPPSSPPPSFVFITEVNAEKEDAIFNYTVLIPVLEEVAVKVVDPATGKIVEETQTVTTYRAEQRAQVLALRELRIISPSGKVVPTDEALKKLAGRIVVDARNGIDERYLKLFKDDVLILVRRAEEESPKLPPE
jgi:hypothetical protein